MYRDDTDEP